MIVVVAGRGGVGATTTAIGLGLALAANHDGPVVLMDARSGTESVSHRLGGEPAPRVVDVAKDPWGATPASSPDGLRVVDGAHWATPVESSVLEDALGVLTAAHSHVLVDIGTDLSERTVPVLAGADHVVLVTNPDRDAAETVHRAAARIAEATRPALDHMLVAVVSRARPRGQLGTYLAEAESLVAIPYDPALAGGGPVRRGLLRPATWQAYLSLAGSVDEGPST